MWRALTHNWSMKLLALGLAVLVWMYAKGVVIKRTEIESSFEVESPRTVAVVVKPEDRSVKLHLSGPAAAIAEMSGRRIQVLHKVKDVENLATDRTDSVLLDQTMVANLPGQVQVVRFEPAEFELTVRPLATMTFPVNPPETVGKPAPGYVVGRTYIRGRSTVTVTGPAVVLKRMQKELKSVDPEPVDVTNRSEPRIARFRRIQTTVHLDNTTTERIQCNDLVEVDVEIRRADVTGVIKAVPISVLADPNFARQVEITSTNPLDLSVEGPSAVVETLTSDQIRAFIDIRNRKPESNVPFFEKLIVHGLPEGVKLAKEEELTVTAKFKAPSGVKKPGP
ncbi:MAG: hypothetical protein AMK75_06445 [Planctomycetes bacterium SM23_65]|nr:MAG: hypothetical protein AMK75_06445 [Planctomycetes bacterium SM23_65]